MDNTPLRYRPHCTGPASRSTLIRWDAEAPQMLPLTIEDGDIYDLVREIHAITLVWLRKHFPEGAAGELPEIQRYRLQFDTFAVQLLDAEDRVIATVNMLAPSVTVHSGRANETGLGA